MVHKTIRVEKDGRVEEFEVLAHHIGDTYKFRGIGDVDITYTEAFQVKNGPLSPILFPAGRFYTTNPDTRQQMKETNQYSFIYPGGPCTVDYWERIPDKDEWKTTTSLHFKKELINVMSVLAEKLGRRPRVIEMGCAQGHTTELLAMYAEGVVAFDVDPENCSKTAFATERFRNVLVVNDDLYRYNPDIVTAHPMKADMAFIDAVHEFNAVKLDIMNALRWGCKVIVLDDYGLFKEVREGVSEVVDKLRQNGATITPTHIGMPKGTIYNNTQNKVLQDWEGVALWLV